MALGVALGGSGGGGGSGTLTTVKDEGTNLSTAVTSIDFVGAGVTATGTTAVTVTIPGASGTAQYTTWDALIPDASPHALTDEFTSNTIANYSTVYTGDAGVTVNINSTAPGGLWFELPSVQYKMRALMRDISTISGGDFTIHTAVSVAALRADACLAQITLANGVTAGSGNQYNVAYGPNSLHGNSPGGATLIWQSYGLNATGQSAPITGPTGGQTQFLRLRKASSVYYGAWSPDGVTWHERTLTVSFTPTYFGLSAQNYGGQVSRITFHYLRVYTTGTQLNTGASRTVYG